MLKTYSDKIRTFSYYMGSYDAPRPILGILADFILILIGIFSTLYLWLVYRTRAPLLSLIVSLCVTSLLGFALYLRKRRHYKKNRKKLRRLVAREYTEKRLSLLSRQEFEWQLIRALSDIKEIKDIEQRQGYIKAQYNGLPIAIGYHHAPPKGYVTYEKVWSFYNSLRSRGYKNLFYISSGYFEEVCNNLIDENLETPLTLLDIDILLDLMEQADMYPKGEMLDHLVQQKIEENKRKQRAKKNHEKAPYKLKRYMVSSLLFLGASFLFRSYFPYYFVLSILFFILGLITQVLSIGKNENTSNPPQ